MQDAPYLPVNWADGMKINKTHFLAQQNAMVFQLAQNTNCILNELNYGILPSGKAEPALKLFITTDNQKKLQVRIQKCRAITYGGYYVEFNEDTALHGNNLMSPVLSTPASLRELKNRSMSFYIVLTINPYQRQPYGSADPTELPPRVPFSLPTLSVDLVPVKEVTRNFIGLTQIPVGIMNIEEHRVILEEDYIPPCSSVSSHPELLEIHAALEQFYSKMETYSLQILQKISLKKQNNEMSVIVQRLCEQILYFTGTYLAEFKSTGLIQPPVSIISKSASLARITKNVLDAYLGSGKEELINYFTEWCNIKQGEFESAVIALATHQYDHMDINRSIGTVSQFTRIVSKLFHQLARLEYIGKRREAGIFVKEEAVRHTDDGNKARRRSFLAD